MRSIGMAALGYRIAASLNVNPGQTAYNPSLAISNGTAYVSWYESNGIADQIYEKHFSEKYLWSNQSTEFSAKVCKLRFLARILTVPWPGSCVAEALIL